jgi:hypothetical protein
VKILHFKQFCKHFVFVEDADGGIEDAISKIDAKIKEQ